MTMTLVFLMAIIFLVLLIWLLWAQQGLPSTQVSALEIKKLLPVHCQHFPQVRRLLGTDDEKFLIGRASRNTLKQWRTERNRILRLYLHGLAEDFQHLQQLARLISALSPELERSQESELLLLGLQFRVLYRMTLLRLTLRTLPLEETARLTELVVQLGLEMQRFLDHMAEGRPYVGITSAT
ncbi:MAG TPA: hypothetical protein VKS20_09160 [Candidatus Acidoferrales bacterium]|nr:hypothetical protein [Candidatus Acidoferrales bacterium]